MRRCTQTGAEGGRRGGGREVWEVRRDGLLWRFTKSSAGVTDAFDCSRTSPLSKKKKKETIRRTKRRKGGRGGDEKLVGFAMRLRIICERRDREEKEQKTRRWERRSTGGGV